MNFQSCSDPKNLVANYGHKVLEKYKKNRNYGRGRGGGLRGRLELLLNTSNGTTFYMFICRRKQTPSLVYRHVCNFIYLFFVSVSYSVFYILFHVVHEKYF